MKVYRMMVAFAMAVAIVAGAAYFTMVHTNPNADNSVNRANALEQEFGN